MIKHPPCERPEDRPMRSTWAKLRISLSVTFITFAAFTLWSRHYLYGIPGSINWKWGLLKASTVAHDWIIMGDSTGLMSIHPGTLEKGLGGSALNFCAANLGSPSRVLMMLECYHRKLGPPTHLVIMMIPANWSQSKQFSRWQSIPIPWTDLVTLKTRLRFNGSDWVKVIVSQLLTASGLNGSEKLSLWFNESERTRPDIYVKGFYGSSRVGRMDSPTNYIGDDQDFCFSPMAREMLDVLSSYADEHRVDVFIVEPPLTATNRHKYHKLQRFMADAFRSYMVSHPRIHYIGPISALPDKYFYNPSHLNSVGAVHYTLDLSRAIRSILGAEAK